MRCSGGPVRLRRLRLLRVLWPYPRVPRRWRLAPALSYGPDPAHLADRYRLREQRGPAPVLVQVHGGGWTGGRPGRQGRPLVHRLALQGWVVFDLEYRLSPRATFPDQLIDVKRAIAWIRATAAEHGAAPSFVAVAGGSAGGHLAALAALTGGDPAYQPGFEEADTTVQACVPVYGVHELLDDVGRPKWPYLASHVLKVTPEAESGGLAPGLPGALRPGGPTSLPGGPRGRRLAGAPGGARDAWWRPCGRPAGRRWATPSSPGRPTGSNPCTRSGWSGSGRGPPGAQRVCGRVTVPGRRAWGGGAGGPQ